MAYKKYIRRGGKVYGPYIYHSKKVKGKVISEYLGKSKEDTVNKREFLIFFSIGIILLLFLLITLSNDNTINESTTNFKNLLIKSSITDFVTQQPQQISETNAKINSIQYPAVVDEPVKWKGEIFSEESGTIKVNLPLEAEKININKIDETGNKEILNAKVTKISPGFFSRILGITSRAISEQGSQGVEIPAESSAKYEINYETPAPKETEEQIGRIKKIKVTGSDSVHYENVLAHATLSTESSEEKIKLYRTTNGVKEKVDFIGYDKNKNGLIDYVEWIVPQLSTQTYELIIEISKAEHLNSNKEFISDIYNQVKSLDDIWSETIPANEYVRITFKQNLTNKRDITIYPRVISGTPIIEVYEKDKTDKIAEFNPIKENEYNKIYLTNLPQDYSQDVFDLRIVGGSLEIDYIVDPTVIILNSGSTWVVPLDWNNEDNFIEAIGAGGNGGLAVNSTSTGAGGGGGEYRKAGNVTLTAGSTVDIHIPLGGDGSASDGAWVKNNGGTIVIEAKNGGNGVTKTLGAGGTGGTGNTANFNGGSGGVGGTGTSGSGAGGGGSAGPTGVGRNGSYGGNGTVKGGGGGGGSNGNSSNAGSAYVTSAGGRGGNGTNGIGGGAGGANGAAGGAGTNGGGGGGGGQGTSTANVPGGAGGVESLWGTNVGPSGGGGGGGGAGGTSATGNHSGGNGGTYGGGGAGGGMSGVLSVGEGNPGKGGQGLIIITYNPADTEYPQFTSYWDNNGSQVNGGIGYFNVTLLSTNGTVILTYNNTNYTATNSSGNAAVFNVTLSGLTDGIYPYNWSSYGNGTLHNYNISNARSYTVNASADNTPPSIDIKYPINNSNFSFTGVDVNYTVYNGQSGCYYTKNSGLTNTTIVGCANLTEVTWGEGVNNVTIYANDTTGNINWSSITFTVDTINPKISIVYPSNNSNFSINTVNINYTVSDTNLKSCWYSNDSRQNATLANCANITTVVWTEGIHNISVWANDSAGNTNVSYITFTVDTVNPKISIVYPSNNSNFSINTVNINYTVSDTNLKSCWYSNDSRQNATLANCANITTVVWTEGIHNISVWANDSAGNTNVSYITFTVDTTYPQFSGYWDNNGTQVTGGTGYFNVTVTSTNGTVILTYNNTNYTASNVSGNPTTFNVTIPSVTNGTYLYNWSSYGNRTLHNYNVSNVRSYTVNISISYSISLSQKLGQQINWSLASLPADSQSAEGNNNVGITEYYINISAEGTTVDLYVKADSNLMTVDLDILSLGNETYSYNSTNASVPSANKFPLTTNYINNKIGENLNNGTTVFLKFFLSAPSGQPAGTYNNTLSFKAVPNGQEP